MFFSPTELARRWNITPRGVVHVGAHLAEEADAYALNSWGKVIWIEAQEDLVAELRNKLNPAVHTIICAAVWDSTGIELDFNIASNSQSSSLLNFGPDSKENKGIKMIGKSTVTSMRLDELLPKDSKADFINLDIQGVDLRALVGLGDRIKDFNYIYLEVNSKHVYEDCALISEIDLYLFQMGFKRVAVRWRLFKHWGDAFYVRNSFTYPLRLRLIQRWMNTKFYILQVLSRIN